MTFRALTYGNCRYKVHLTPPAVETIQTLTRESKDLETGGILMGHYQDGEAWVMEATPPPPDSVRSYATFERGTDGLGMYLSQKWRATQRLYYLGEWHSHQANHAHPSVTDHKQMRQVATDPCIDCAFPILIVAAGLSIPFPVLSVNVYEDNGQRPIFLYL